MPPYRFLSAPTIVLFTYCSMHVYLATSSVEVSAGNFQSDPVNQSLFAPNREEPIGQESEGKHLLFFLNY